MLARYKFGGVVGEVERDLKVWGSESRLDDGRKKRGRTVLNGMELCFGGLVVQGFFWGRTSCSSEERSCRFGLRNRCG